MSREIEENLRAIIRTPGFAKQSEPEVPFPSRDALSRFRREGLIGKTYGGIVESPHDVRLKDAPSYWLRLQPMKDFGRRWTTNELKKLATAPTICLWPLAAFSSSLSFSYVRGDDGFGVFVPVDKDAPTSALVYAFETGEVWGIDAFHANASGAITLPIADYVAALNQYRAFLKDALKIEPPYQMEVGIDRIRDEKVWLPPPRKGHVHLQNPYGSSIANDVRYTAVIDASADSWTALRPFFERLLEKCGVEDAEAMLIDLSPGQQQ